MRSSHHAPEAPTHLRAGDLPPGLVEDPRSGASRTGHSLSARPTHRRGEPAKLPAIPPYDQDQPSLVSVSRSRSHSRSRSRLLEPAPAPLRMPTEPASATPAGRDGREPLARAASPVLSAAAATPHLRKPQTPGQTAAAAALAQPVQLGPAPSSSSSMAKQLAAAAQPRPSSSTSAPSASASRSASAPSAPSASSSSRAGASPAASRPGSSPRPATQGRLGSRPAPLPAAPAGPAAAAAAAAAVAAAAAMPAMAGIGAVDPMIIPTPPELAGPIYSYIRRLALQADLPGADRVLRDALAELTSSLSCTIVYPGQDGLWTLGDDDEIPRDAQPLVAVATARRAVIASHVAMIPVVTSSETVAVITLTRNSRQPAYQPIEQLAMVALARDAAPILHHLAVQHLQHAREIKADKGSLYRGEALEAHRKRGQEGVLVQLSPGWVKRAYPLLIITIVAAVIFAVFIRVPTYSTGTAVIVFEGSVSVTSMTGGTVEKVFVRENEAVKQGDPLVRLNSPDEAAQLTAAETEWQNMKIQFLFDQTDEQIRKSLMSAATSRDHALARVESRTIRAPRDGVVTNLHVKEGAPVQPGGYVMQVTDENSEIEVLAFLPGKDGPRLRDTMGLQLELDGYTKARAIGKITSIKADAISAQEAAKLGGDLLAETIAKDLQTGPTWVAVRARLPSRTFKAEHNTYHYHHGMHAKVEVKVQTKPFVVTLLPALEKYLPE